MQCPVHLQCLPHALLDLIGEDPFLSTIELTKGYWQTPLAPEDKEKTTFATPSGVLQFHKKALWAPWGRSFIPESDGQSPGPRA